MDGTEVKLGHDVIPPLNHNLSKIFDIHLVKDEILKYLDGSALINLSSVTKGIRNVVTLSNCYKKKVNLKVNTKSMDFFTTTIDPLPEWTVHLTHLTLVCDSEQIFLCQEKFSSFTRILPSLSTLNLISGYTSYANSTTFINMILNLSSNLKSLSIDYPFMLNPITFNPQLCQNLKELKFTTFSTLSTFTTYLQGHNFTVYSKMSTNFEQNLKTLATNCINLKSFSCQELSKVQGRYVNEYNKKLNRGNVNFFNWILRIIENNSESLEKLEFGISLLLIAYPDFSSKLKKISLPNLKFLIIRAMSCDENDYDNGLQYGYKPVMDILHNLPSSEQLITLKLYLDSLPVQLLKLIKQKFSQLKSLSLKASIFDTIDPEDDDDENSFLFLQSFTQLEELEIINFKMLDGIYDKFGLEILDEFPDFLQNNNLRKLSLHGANQVCASTFLHGIGKLKNLKELALTGSSIYLDDFLSICNNFKLVEKLEISDLFADKFNPESSDNEKKIDYTEILAAFSSLKYLKELLIEFWSGDFSTVLGSMSFPYLKKLTLCNANLKQDQVENMIGLNEMLNELSIISLKYSNEELDDDNFEIVNKRNNLKIDFSSKQVECSPSGRTEIREELDPDSVPLRKQTINW